jgi:hypothetical protein
MHHFWSICKGKGHGSMNGFNAVGLGFELLGIILIWIHAKKTADMASHEITGRYGPSRWLHVGIRLIVFGFLIQLIGFFFG